MHQLVAVLMLLSTTVILQAESIDAALRSLPTGTSSSVLLSRCSDGTVVFQDHPEQAQRLASVTKLFVSAAALLEYGPQHQIITNISSYRPLINGHCQSLYITGSGDPCLDEHFSKGKPEDIFTTWIAALQQQGLTHIDGDLIIDDSLFSGPDKAPTWPQDHRNMQQWYSAPASAFAWLDNCIEAQVQPGSLGSKAVVHYRPFATEIKVVNKTRTVSSVKRPRILVSRAERSNTITVSGAYAQETAWFPLAIHDNPALLHGQHFLYRLRDAGIIVSGQVRLGLTPERHHVLHSHSSTLGPALTILNQRSQNFYGEQLFRLIGAQRFRKGNLDTGKKALKRILQEKLNIHPDLHNIIDGSGLSYDNSASASTVCALLSALQKTSHAQTFHDSLKNMTIDKQPFFVKTGTLAVARCLAGYFTKNEQCYAFAILLNKEAGAVSSWSSSAKQAYKRIASAMFHTCP